MRRNIQSSGAATKKTAKDYVQAGLVAMWDGIENAGFGLHDGAATRWTNLISGETTASGATFADDGLEMTTSSTALVFASNDIGDQFLKASGGCTLEFVVTDKSVLTSTAVRVFFGSSNTNILGFRYQRSSNSGGTSSVLIGFFGDTVLLRSPYYTNLGSEPYKHLATLVYNNATRETALWVDGVKCSEATSRVYSWAESLMRSFRFYANDYVAHGIRLYNRALNPAEVAANYAVDKARFGI